MPCGAALYIGQGVSLAIERSLVAGTRIYLDHAATTPVLPEARAAMMEALGQWANPSSPHAEGRAARAALEDARERIKRALGWDGELIFTSGSTEALAIALRAHPARIVSPLEHDAVRRLAPDAERLTVSNEGIVQMPGSLPGGLYAIQHVNNETGVIQSLNTLAGSIRAAGGLLLADCAQSAGKLPLPEADVIVFSAHKFGGPPGIGALLVRDLALLQPIGGQEQGYRPGTQNLPAVLAMAAALEASKAWLGEAARLRTRLEHRLTLSGGEVVAAGVPRIATIGAYRMPGVPANAQLIEFDLAGISVSAGSACSSGSLKISPVLAAMAWPDEAAREVVRVSFGPDTDDAAIQRFAETWERLAARRRAA